MAHEPRIVTIKLPPELLEKLDRLSRDSNRSLDEVVYEAVSQYVNDDDWQELLDYGTRQADRQALAPDDVERLIDEYRSETR
jgi:predicted transcriptional regulator